MSDLEMYLRSCRQALAMLRTLTNASALLCDLRQLEILDDEISICLNKIIRKITELSQGDLNE